MPAIMSTTPAIMAGTREPVTSLRNPDRRGARTADDMTDPLKKPTAAPIEPGCLLLTMSPTQEMAMGVKAVLLKSPKRSSVAMMAGVPWALVSRKRAAALIGRTRSAVRFLPKRSESRPQRMPPGRAVRAMRPV